MRGMRQSGRKTDYERAREILARAEYGVLSTTCDDGLPYGVPLSFVLTGFSLYFHCAPEGQKLDNIMHDSRACLTAVTAASNLGNRLSMAYESAMAFGTVRPVYPEDERQAALRLLCDKYAPEMPQAALNAYLKKQGPNTIVLRMDVEYIVGKAAHMEELKEQKEGPSE